MSPFNNLCEHRPCFSSLTQSKFYHTYSTKELQNRSHESWSFAKFLVILVGLRGESNYYYQLQIANDLAPNVYDVIGLAPQFNCWYEEIVEAYNLGGGGGTVP